MPKDDKWFESINWDEECMRCHSRNGGICHLRLCAELHYDEWGDLIPPWVYYMDGNDLEKYLAEKRARLAKE